MSRIRIGVLRGGPSGEYDVSLKTGSAVLKHLPEETYAPVDILVDRRGTWHIGGMPLAEHQAFKRVDVIFNALHGAYGEDGEVQRLLELHRVPYTGSGVLSSALAMHKGKAKELFAREGLRTPQHRVLKVSNALDKDLVEIFQSVPPPFVVKPMSSGSSLGVSIVPDFQGLYDAARLAFEHSPEIIIEEYIRGKEATCAVIDAFRGEEYYTLPPVEIIPPQSAGFFDYNAKYGGATQEVCPGHFSRAEKEAIQDAARRAHCALGMRHYSRTDMMVSPRGVFVLEVNALPGLTEQSLLPRSLDAVGASLSQFLDHIVSLAAEGR